jgi:NaMN:DMB phosphoribosyltransferase
VVREGVGAGGEMTQALYAHMNNKKIKIKKKINKKSFSC